MIIIGICFLCMEFLAPHLNEVVISHSQINYDQRNQWVWFPKSKGTKISSMIYSHFNQIKSVQNNWVGQTNLWCLKVAPKVKYFTWLNLHNAVKTYEYHYRMNSEPQAFGCFCNLQVETIDHLFHMCCKSQGIWEMVSSEIMRPVNLCNSVSSGLQLCQDTSGNYLFT